MPHVCLSHFVLIYSMDHLLWFLPSQIFASLPVFVCLFFSLSRSVCVCVCLLKWWPTKCLRSKETHYCSTKGASPTGKKPSKMMACMPGASGLVRPSSSWPWRDRSSAWATSGGSHTSATRTEEVKHVGFSCHLSFFLPSFSHSLKLTVKCLFTLGVSVFWYFLHLSHDIK